MGVLLVIVAIIFAVLGLLIFRGGRILKLREAALKRMEAQSGKKINILGGISYHGGFPQIPKPQKLTLAMTDNDIMLVTNKGQVEVLPFNQWQKVDKFTTLTKHDPKRKSVVLWGPLNNLIFADRQRHFIVVKYQDSDNQYNNLLIEYGNLDLLNEIFEKLNAGWNHYQRRVASV